ncbi:uncharacterized protein LOC115019861 isoform X2 [Cottoperca gobio]|uniref:Uncharacterized protein LOC115019861 isoform X2 n=1 Tax=Cottoperca gobio TaxID=56716 RepID=A0A6J2R5D8_COTGO|nr:uncharacterized protein LOC115019861 isoform X2 [Cottoperca gobio]
MTRSLTTLNQALITVQGEQQSRVISFIITLSLLVVIVLVTLFICLMFKRHKQNKIDPPATTTAKEEVTYSTVKKKRKTSSHLHQAEEAVTYSTVKPMRRTSDQRDVDVIYSSVLHVEQHTVHTVNLKRFKPRLTLFLTYFRIQSEAFSQYVLATLAARQYGCKCQSVCLLVHHLCQNHNSEWMDYHKNWQRCSWCPDNVSLQMW